MAGLQVRLADGQQTLHNVEYLIVEVVRNDLGQCEQEVEADVPQRLGLV